VYARDWLKAGEPLRPCPADARIDVQFGLHSASKAPDASAAKPYFVAASTEQRRLLHNDQVLPIGAPFGAFHRHPASCAGCTPSTLLNRREPPCRLGQSIVLPRLRPISPAPMGVSTDTRLAAMSASLGKTSST